jgi:hypothetical protein
MDVHTFSTINLEIIKSKIENMSKKHHIEILKILKTNSLIKINENKSGIYINLSFLPNETINELYKYIDYISKQEDSLNNIENQKNMLKNEFLLFN